MRAFLLAIFRYIIKKINVFQQSEPVDEDVMCVTPISNKIVVTGLTTEHSTWISVKKVSLCVAK